MTPARARDPHRPAVRPARDRLRRGERRVAVAPTGRPPAPERAEPLLRPTLPTRRRRTSPTSSRALAARGATRSSPRAAPALARRADGRAGVAAVEVWRERMRAHDDAAYVHLCVDERAGAPRRTPSCYALDFVPAAVARERERFGAHAVRTMGANLLEDLVADEVRRRERIVAIDDEAVLLCPYASPHPFQLMLAPRRRRERFEDDGADRRRAPAPRADAAARRASARARR